MYYAAKINGEFFKDSLNLIKCVQPLTNGVD